MKFAAKTRPCLFMTDTAEEAAHFYVARLPGSRIENVVRPDPSQPALVVEFSLTGSPFMAMNGNPEFTETHSFSISVLTDDQGETDRLWNALMEDGGTEGRCGWLKDRFGVHWQIVPKALPELMNQGGEAGQQVQASLMKMGKIDIATLRRAASGSNER